MTKIKTVLLILFIALLVATVSSCDNTEEANKSNTIKAISTVGEKIEAKIIETEIPLGLPDDLNLNGEAINIWYFTQNSDVSEKFINIEGELNGDIIDEKLYYRNLTVEEKLNVDLVFTDTGVKSGAVGSEIRKIIMSGSTDYDVFNVVQWNSAKYVAEGLYLNIIDAPYIDIEKPWWSTYYINEINIGKNSRFLLCGDISIDMIRCIGCMYFNKNMYNNYFDNADDLYQTVLDGGWTIDKLSKLAQDTYKDLNGDSVVDENDQFGLFTNNYNNIDILFYGADIRITERDKNGIPHLVLNNDRTASLIKSLYELCYNNQGVYFNTVPSDGTLWNNKRFNDGYGLFLTGFLYSSELLRDMKDDYGIIPTPKYDENQENYRAAVHDIATLTCLPSTCTKLDSVSAVLEMLAYESRKNITPAYYETAMKTKYTRDALSSQIIDLLHDNNMTDMAYSYGENFNRLGLIASDMLQAKNDNFASYYAGKETAALIGMQKLIDKCLELE